MMQLLLALSFISAAVAFDWAMGNTSLWLSAASYCDRNTYFIRNYLSYSAGFVATKAIYNDNYDVEGMIGYRPNDQSIYVVFRGSQSTQNWVDNLKFFKTDYPYCPGGKVHDCFYKAQLTVIADVMSEVKRLRSLYPSYKVVATGHSLGAALATLTAIDLIAAGIPTTLFNFGSPRVFDDNGAICASNKLQTRYRVTHHKDMVPHIPMDVQGFKHIEGEWYEDSYDVRACTGYEDSSCADQWHLTSIDDHSLYLGFVVHCANVSR